MNRKAFIQTTLAGLAPRLIAGEISYEYALRSAEKLWQRMTEDGYGAREQKELAPKESWYKSMPDKLRQQFDRFWQAYDNKHDRDVAAKAWMQIPDMDDSLAETIITAAGMDKARSQSDTDYTRKYPQGWLTKRCWEDYDTSQARTAPENQQRRKLQSKRAELSQLLELNRNGELDGQIAQLREEIRELEADLKD